MAEYGNWQVATILAGNTDSGVIDLGRTCDLLGIIIPTLVSCTIKIEVSETVSGTYYDLGEGITTASGTHSYADEFKLGGYQFIKVVASQTQTTTDRLIRVRGIKHA